MAFENVSFDATLAAVAGHDAKLNAELRESFAESLASHLDLLSRARCDANWRVAAGRLRGLAAGFHAYELQAMAEEALAGAPGEPGIVRRIRTYLTEFRARR